MKERTQANPALSLARVGMVAAATLAALLLTVALVVAQGPNFEDSYKSGPDFADSGDTITYTIVAVNTGDPVQDVVLSDTMPSGVTVITCSVSSETGGTSALPCNLNQLWERDFDTGDRVTTTITVELTGGTLQFPLVNRAHISWPTDTVDIEVETTLNPFRYYLPIVFRGFG